MNKLSCTVIQSLLELGQGMDGSLTMTDAMEGLMNAIASQKLPESWIKIAWPSERTLGGWVDNLCERFEQLDDFTKEPNIMAKVTYINKLFGPSSFLNAVKQVTSQDKKIPLNEL